MSIFFAATTELRWQRKDLVNEYLACLEVIVLCGSLPAAIRDSDYSVSSTQLSGCFVCLIQSLYCVKMTTYFGFTKAT